MLVFEESWKLEYPEENLSKQGLEPTATNQPTVVVGGKCSHNHSILASMWAEAWPSRHGQMCILLVFINFSHVGGRSMIHSTYYNKAVLWEQNNSR